MSLNKLHSNTFRLLSHSTVIRACESRPNKSSSKRSCIYSSIMTEDKTSTSACSAGLNFNSLKGVLFDIDGTLTNSDPLHFKAFQQVLVERGYDGGNPISEEFYRKHISGRHNPEIAADLFPTMPEDQRRQFYEEKEERFRTMAGSGELLPLFGLMDFMSWIDLRGLRKAAVTNAPKANTKLMLTALKLDNYFEAVVLGEECERAKPFPDPYRKGMQLLGLSPEHTLVVEDSPAGIRAGVAAGIPVIGLTTGQQEGALREAGAILVCRDFAEIMELITAASYETVE
ncbi:hypothetical protein CEUSTIGMA_g3555.t1 [Chlamydomonas eustigma]|uniref:Haloacid dehalogenase-like hydrolase domain-containing protein Sgpp n=1 Tax=Chlamydomonas eustigma TaxID=1157962 RepID=A0A250WZR8_9CHLO|nr:hypothetical protein CEUSTIGMA_g3555.t1 [Chlamydomonas eustigma]|eukprot:GAX76112.1 hypothetical protein CEUSTIGMA_g3555.t1 [Chlamydomonas eustigma]